MFKNKLITACSLLALSVASHAAEPTRKMGDWSGTHFGMNWGATQTKADFTMQTSGDWLTAEDSADGPWIDAQGSPELKSRGFTMGVQIGRDWQKGKLVYGIEGDIAYNDSQKSRETGYLESFTGAPIAFVSSTRSTWSAAIKPRVGLALGPCLVYGTVGFAMADLKYQSAYIYEGTPNGVIKSQTLRGLTAGAGLEVATSEFWAAKAELLYTSYGKTKKHTTQEDGYNVPAVAEDTYNATQTVKVKELSFKVGMNYRF